MKRFMKFISVILVLSAVVTASTLGGNPEVWVKRNPIVVEWDGGNHCDPIERLMGMCKSSENILAES
jgi:hypothetical protein